MDLVMLVTACALGVEPKLMHALVWQQSGGEPWAVSVPNGPMPRVYSSMQQAISETRTASVAPGIVRVGLAGLPVAPSKASPAMFLPCRNVAIAAQRIAKLADRCRAHPRLKGDPTLCAVAVYHGSWERPDVRFAEAVMATAAKGDAPNFDMPKDTSIEFLDIGSDTTPPPNDPSPGTDSASDERERGWSSALFPPKPKPPEGATKDSPNDEPIAQEAPSVGVTNAHPFAAKAPADSLFSEIVRSEAVMTDLDTNRKNSQNIAPVAKGQGGGERPAARWQDKSREERGGRSVGKGAMIKDLARCAPANERLPIRTSYCNYRQERTSRSERDDTRR